MSVLPLGVSPTNFTSNTSADTNRAAENRQTDDRAVTRETPPTSGTETAQSAPVAPPEPAEQAAPTPPERPDEAFAEREAAAAAEAARSEAEAVAQAALDAEDATGLDVARAAAEAYEEQARIQESVSSPVGAEDEIDVTEDEDVVPLEVISNDAYDPEGPSAGDNPLDKVA